MQLALPGENGRELADLARARLAGTLVRRSGRGLCLQPYRQLPSRHRQAAQQYGNARWFVRPWRECYVCKNSKSIEGRELAVTQEDCCCNIPISLINPAEGKRKL